MIKCGNPKEWHPETRGGKEGSVWGIVMWQNLAAEGTGRSAMCAEPRSHSVKLRYRNRGSYQPNMCQTCVQL